MNGTALILRPAVEDGFLASMATDPTMERFIIQRDASGQITGLDYSGVPFTRVD